MIIKPQEGYQEKVLSTSADICISGASAGVGKSFALLLEFTRHVHNPKWGGVIFRRTTPQIRNQGGLWDASMGIYPHLSAQPKESSLEWRFPSGSEIKFSHLEYEKDKLNFQGSEIPFIGFDELPHFTESQFFYLLSRSRSTCGVSPYVRATCNPDPDSWVATLVEWWIDRDTGYPIPERDGVIRYFTKNSGGYVWGDSKEEVIEKASYFLDEMVEKSEGVVKHEDFVKSITFISGSIYDNKELLSKNPEYLANLQAQDPQTKAQLLDGNWKHVENRSDIYEYSAFLDVFTNEHLPFGEPRITADVAMDGSDKFIVITWRGFVIVDVVVVDKSDGAIVLDKIRERKNKFGVAERNICYDSDGVGRYLKGFLKTSVNFDNGGKPLLDEKYKNLKTQCYYRSGIRVNENGIYIVPEVAESIYSGATTIKQRLLQERRAIKKYKIDDDGKKQINPKSDQKVINNGESPDLMDAFMMIERLAMGKQRTKLTSKKR